MWYSIMKGSFVGGVIIFLWMTISWMILPFHGMNIQKVAKEKELAINIMNQTAKDGIYVLPSWGADNEFPTNTPFIFMSIKRSIDLTDMTSSMFTGFLIYLVGAGLITYLLITAEKIKKYWDKVLFITVIGFIIALLGNLPTWNWWHYPFGFVFFDIADSVLGCFLAALGISAVTSLSPTA